MNAAGHWRQAERWLSRAEIWATENDLAAPENSAEVTQRLAIADTHLRLAVASKECLLWFDGRRDPDDMEAGEGWPPSHGDIWRDTEGRSWVYETDGQMRRIGDETYAAPEALNLNLGPLTLAYRAYVPSLDNPFSDEAPF